MLIGIYADPHFSRSSSIVVGKSGDFSGRLNNLIESFKWMNDFFADKGVSDIICLGDLVDKPVLHSEEITAMSKCNIDSHIILVGNHCRSDKDGKINAISNYEKVFSSPGFLNESLGIFLLPYNKETIDLRSISPRPRIILSHNDIKGYDLGGHTLDTGYDVSEILDSCDLFINGHLHNGGWVVKDRIINLGTLSGMNFSSCGGEWEPSVAILDTDTLKIEIFENPKAYRFKKVEFDKLTKVKGYLSNLPSSNYVLQVKVPEDIAQSTRKLIDQSNKVVSSRIITYSNNKKESKSKVDSQLISDHRSIYDKLKDFINGTSSKYSLEVMNKIIDEISQVTEGEV